MLYQVKVAYERGVADNPFRKVSEVYLVDALSVTEAEARMIKELSPYVSVGDLEVKDVRRYNVADILNSPEEGASTYYKARVAYLTLNERTGAEQRQVVTILIKAEGVRDAIETLLGSLESVLGEYKVFSVTETAIMDIYRYEAEAV